jgi:hypothetical protein
MLQKQAVFASHGMPYHIDIGQIMTIAILQNILSHQVITEFLRMKTARDCGGLTNELQIPQWQTACQVFSSCLTSQEIREELKVVFLHLLFLSITFV